MKQALFIIFLSTSVLCFGQSGKTYNKIITVRDLEQECELENRRLEGSGGSCEMR